MRIRAACEQTAGGQAFEAVRENVGGDPLNAFGQEGSKTAASTSKHGVAQDDQAPAVTEGFEGQIDRASGASKSRRALLTGCKIGLVFTISRLVPYSRRK